MIVIGADTHKRKHVLSAVNGATGALVDELEITADVDGHLRALAWAQALDAEIVWALEDCRLVAGRPRAGADLGWPARHPGSAAADGAVSPW
jgi:hypothetical protein